MIIFLNFINNGQSMQTLLETPLKQVTDKYVNQQPIPCDQDLSYNSKPSDLHQQSVEEKNLIKEKKDQQFQTPLEIDDPNSDEDEDLLAEDKIENSSDSQVFLEEGENQRKEEIELLEMSSYQFNFDECLPGTVHEKAFNIKLNADLPAPKNIYVYILCEDQRLNSLPEYVFGIRKQSSYDYFDEFKFKVSKQGEFAFVLGAKVPNITQNNPKENLLKINCKLFIWLDGFSDRPMESSLNMSIKAPMIVCTRQLTLENQARFIKLSVVISKSKKDCRVPFKVFGTYSDNRILTLETEIMGLQTANSNPHKSRVLDLDVKPKILNVSGEGQMFLNFSFNFTEQIRAQLQRSDQKVSCCIVRKVLLIKIRNTNCIYHFPVEARFYNDANVRGQSNSQ